MPLEKVYHVARGTDLIVNAVYASGEVELLNPVTGQTMRLCAAKKEAV